MPQPTDGPCRRATAGESASATASESGRTPPQDPLHDILQATPKRWFARGFLVAVMLFGALNAASYFFRSEAGGNLLGLHPERQQSLGFPVRVWYRIGNGMLLVDGLGSLINTIAALISGAILGLLAAKWSGPLNRRVQEIVGDAGSSTRRPWQFSLRTMALATGIAAVAATLSRYTIVPRPEVLAMIYLTGPTLLVGLAMAPRGVSWQTRVTLLTPMALLVIVGAFVIGANLPQPLDFVQIMLGIFVCWTPQSALAAILVTTWTLLFAPPAKVA